MTEYGTIKIPREQYDRHNERRQEMGVSWAEYIDGQAINLEDTKRRVVREELEEIQS